MRITRRRWAGLVGIAPFTAKAALGAQGAPPPQRPQKPEVDVRQVSERLAQIELPMNLEPAFVFRP